MSYNPRHINLDNGGIKGLLKAIELANRNAQAQRTNKSGTMFISSGEMNDDGMPKGTLVGQGSQNGGIAQWVNDSTPPGKPMGLSVSSKTGMVFVTWDGSIENGVPNDFDHLQVLVDGKDVGWLSAKGTVVDGPYDIGSNHSITAYAYDNAHSSDGSPSPNKSEVSDRLTVTVSGAEIDEESLGITVTKSEKEPYVDGVHKGDLWLKYPVALSTNIITDPGMESTEAWTWNGLGLGRVTDPNGTYFRMRPSMGWCRLDNTGTIHLAPGDKVQVSVTRQCENTQNGIDMYLGVKDSKGTDQQKKLDPVGYGEWVTDTVRIAIPANAKADDYTLDFSVNNTSDNTNTVVLCKNISISQVMPSALEAEWWWDGSKWVPIPVAIYLDQLAARSVEIDSAVIGALSAGIIKSGSFVTPDGRVGFDTNGFWAKNTDGEYVFQASENGVNSIGGFVTASSGDRIQLSQTLIQGTNTGGLQGIGDDPNHPYWLIWGDHSGSGSGSQSKVSIGTTPQQPQFTAVSSSSETIASVSGTKVNIAGTSVNLDSSNLKSNNIDISSADYTIDSVIGFWSNIQNYRGFMKLYKRAGVYYLDFNVQMKNGGKFPQNVLTPCIKISDSVRSLVALDAWGYGSYGDISRVHVFGGGESYDPGTVSVTVKGTNVDYVSCQLHWVR